MTPADIVEILASCRFRFGSEDDLQEGIAQALTSAGHQVEREVRLDSRNRVDVLVEKVGVEVKVGGRPDAVLRQLTRYADSDLISGLLLFTTRSNHRAPESLNGKPVAVFLLAGVGL